MRLLLVVMVGGLLGFYPSAHAEKVTRNSAIDWKKAWHENYERFSGWLMQGDYAALDKYYNGKQKAYEDGLIDEYVLQWEFRVFSDVIKHVPSHSYLLKWVAASPQSYAAHLVVGWMHQGYGDQLRGSKFAIETTPEQFAQMQREYSKAAPHFLQSLTLTAKPVLSYEAILYTFRSAEVAMATFAPHQNVKPAHDITGGEGILTALTELAKAMGPTPAGRTYSQADLHRAMWHYARQGYAVAPDSQIISDTYFDLIKPKWYGSNAMMAAFAERAFTSGAISQRRYRQMLYTIPWDMGLMYGDDKRPGYDPVKAAALFLEASQKVSAEDDPGYYYHATARYLMAAHDLAAAQKLDDLGKAQAKKYLVEFLAAEQNPYRSEQESQSPKVLPKIKALAALLGDAATP